MADERTTPALLGLIGGLVASLVVALTSGWVSAEAERAEALRRERRQAYADLVGTARSCHVDQALNLLDPNLPEPVVKARASATFRRCLPSLEISAARVYLLTDNDDVVHASDNLRDRGLTIVAGDEHTYDTFEADFVEAIDAFERTARADVMAPVVSPLLLRSLTYTGVQLLAWGAVLIPLFFGMKWAARLWGWRERGKTEHRP